VNWTRRVLLALTAIIVLVQLVPYGRNHGNPPIVAEPRWSSPSVRALAKRACFDCHSNESHWPWYSNVAPVSWLIQHDVDEGRAAVNFSEWNRPQKEAADSAKSVVEGEMPPAIYLPLHPEARLAAAERDELVSGLRATFGDKKAGGEND